MKIKHWDGTGKAKGGRVVTTNSGSCARSHMKLWALWLTTIFAKIGVTGEITPPATAPPTFVVAIKK